MVQTESLLWRRACTTHHEWGYPILFDPHHEDFCVIASSQRKPVQKQPA